MKLLKSIFTTLAVASIATAMVSCSDNDNEYDSTILLPFTSDKIEFNTTTGAWDNCYVENAENSLNYVDFHFSHSANEAWQSWYGFCPTVSKDNADHSDNWIANQWGSIAGGGVFPNIPYMLCFWDSFGEMDPTDIPDNPSLCIKFNKGTYTGFYPRNIAVTNSAYGYYALKNGTPYNRAFEDGDRFTLIIVGMMNGAVTGQVEFDLADGRNILKEWKNCDLSSLGKVDQLYFRMTSTDSGEWGINNPTYFCMDNFQFSFTE